MRSLLLLPSQSSLPLRQSTNCLSRGIQCLQAQPTFIGITMRHTRIAPPLQILEIRKLRLISEGSTCHMSWIRTEKCQVTLHVEGPLELEGLALAELSILNYLKQKSISQKRPGNGESQKQTSAVLHEFASRRTTAKNSECADILLVRQTPQLSSARYH